MSRAEVVLVARKARWERVWNQRTRNHSGTSEPNSTRPLSQSMENSATAMNTM